MRWMLIVGSAIAIAVLAACGGSEPDQAETDDLIAEKLAEQYAEDGDEEPPASVEDQRVEFMTDCMNAEGFEYLQAVTKIATSDPMEIDPREYTLRYGFGLSTDFESLADSFDQPVEEDPAQTALEAMSESERSDYMGQEELCLQESYIEFGLPENGAVWIPEDSDIMERMDAAYQAAAQDERVEQARLDWSRCMQEQGYDFAALEDMIGPLESEAMPLQEAFLAAISELAASGSSVTDVTSEEVLSAEQVEQLHGLQQRELTTAAAHQTCIDRGFDFEAVLAEVTDEYLVEEFGS